MAAMLSSTNVDFDSRNAIGMASRFVGLKSVLEAVDDSEQ